MQILSKSKAVGTWPELAYLEDQANRHRSVKFVITCGNTSDYEKVKRVLSHTKPNSLEKPAHTLASRIVLLVREKVEEVQILKKFVWSAESWSLIPVERNEAASFPQQVANNKGTWTFATRLVWENEEEQSLGPENLLSEIKNLPSPDEDELERERKRMLLLQLMTCEWEKAGKLEEFRVSRLDLELFAPPAAAWEPSSSIMTE
ncbi:unnamed protein product [Oikopleura dioica]|uniref:Uncharacterized protein n=1 Tax=Oikopleura dioica TaxID=34765 RepID=E4XCL1_OIKDI|nr:unnamed protein product [Oikopleura dioica]